MYYSISIHEKRVAFRERESKRHLTSSRRIKMPLKAKKKRKKERKNDQELYIYIWRV